MDETASARRTAIVSTALALLERHGPDGVTMRAIADQLGIQAPSLYKHIPGKDALEVEMIAQGLGAWPRQSGDALHGSDDALGDAAQAYREWALRRPPLYRLMTGKPMPRDQLPAGLEAA